MQMSEKRKKQMKKLLAIFLVGTAVYGTTESELKTALKSLRPSPVESPMSPARSKESIVRYSRTIFDDATLERHVYHVKTDYDVFLMLEPFDIIIPKGTLVYQNTFLAQVLKHHRKVVVPSLEDKFLDGWRAENKLGFEVERASLHMEYEPVLNRLMERYQSSSGDFLESYIVRFVFAPNK
jgi:hypothetical protein